MPSLYLIERSSYRRLVKMVCRRIRSHHPPRNGLLWMMRFRQRATELTGVMIAVLLAVGGACSGHGRSTDGSSHAPADPGSRHAELDAERAALGWVGDLASAKDTDRLRAIVNHAKAIGDRDEALEALALWLGRARVRRALAGADGSAKGLSAAEFRRQRIEIAELAIALDAPWMANDALAGEPGDAPDVDALRARYVLDGRLLTRDDSIYDNALELTATDLSARLQVEMDRGTWRASKTPSSILTALGARSAVLLQRRFADAVNKQDVDALAREAAALRRVDPYHLGAHLLPILEAERSRARADDHAISIADLLAFDLRQRYLPPPLTLGRLYDQAQNGTLSPGETLSRIGHMLANRAYGDAVVRIDELLASEDLDRATRALAATMRGYAALAVGDRTTYDTWRREHSHDSAALLGWCEFLRETGAAETMGDTLRSELVRGLNAQLVDTEHALLDLAKDDAFSGDVRRRAIAQLRERSTNHLAQIATGCIEDGSTLDACEERLAAYQLLLSSVDERFALASEWLTAVRRVVDLEGFDANWLRGLTLDAEDATNETLDALLVSLRRRDFATGTAHLDARMRLALAKGDAETLARLLDAHEMTLSPSDRLMWRLAQRAVGETPKTRSAALDALWSFDFPPTVGEPTAEPSEEDLASIEQSYRDNHPWDRWHRAHAYLRRGAFDKAIADLEATVEMIPASVTGPVWAVLHVAHREAGHAASARRWLDRLREDFPDAFETRLVLAQSYERAQQWDAASQAYVRAWLLRPDASVAARGLMLSRARAGELTALRAMAEAGPKLPGWSDELRDLVRANEATTERVVDTLAAYEDNRRAFELGPTAIPTTLIWPATNWASTQIRKLDDVAEAMAIAQRLAAFWDEMSEAAKDNHTTARQRAWLYFLLGRTHDAEQLAPELAASDRFRIAALSPLRDTARQTHLTDEQALAIWRLEMGFNPKSVTAVARILEQFPADPGAIWYVCRRYLDADMDDVAVDVCGRAWKTRSAKLAWFTDLAMAASYLTVSRPEDARRVGMRTRDWLSPSRAGRAALSSEGGWWYNRALTRAAEGEYEAAADDLRRAWASGYSEMLAGLPDELLAVVLGPAGFLGRVVVLRRGGDMGDALAYASLFALSNAELDVARVYAEAATRWPTTDDLVAASMRQAVLDLVPFVVSDIEHGRLDRVALGELWQGQGETAVLTKLKTRYPNSATIQLVWAQARLMGGEAKEVRETIDRLVAAYPDSAVATQTAVAVYMLAGEVETARKLLVGGLDSHPDDERLLALAKQLSVATGTGELPDWMKTPTAFDRALPEIERGKSTVVHHTGVDERAEVFVPEAFLRHDVDRLAFSNDDTQAVIHVGSTPLPRRCDPQQCVQNVLPGFADVGLEAVWNDTETLPAGEAGRVLLRRGERVAMVWAIPARGRLLLLTGSAPYSEWKRLWPALRLARDSLRPLDAVVGSGLATALRAMSWQLPPDSTRAWARRLTAANTTPRCPLTRVLDQLESRHLVGALLLDTFLATPDPGQRRALVSCRPPEHDDARLVGLAALLSEDSVLFEYGRAVTQAAPEVIVDQAVRVLEHGGWQVASLRHLGERQHTPYGALQVAAALPNRERESYMRHLLQAGDRHAHVLGLGAAVVADQPLPAELRQADIRHAGPSLVTLAILGLPSPLAVEDVAAVRRRLAAVEGIESREDLLLVRTAVDVLAPLGDAEDLDVLARVNRLADRRGELEHRPVRQAIDAAVRGHAAVASRAVSSDQTDLGAWMASAWKQITGAASTSPASISRHKLRTQSLPELLPAGPWRYARVHRPGVMHAVVRDVTRSLELADRQQTIFVRWMLGDLAERRGSEFLEPENGLDRSAPIECASPDGLSAFVCTARLADPAVFSRRLPEYRDHVREGALLLLHAAEYATNAAVALGNWPTLLHEVVGARAAAPAIGAELVAERVRIHEEIAGFDLERHTTVKVREGQGATVDGEYYLVVGDRLWVFSDAWLARLVLSPSRDRGESLADSARFRSMSHVDGRGQLSSIVLARSGRANDHAVMATVDSQGIHASWFQGSDADSYDVTRLLAHLPDGAASSFATTTRLGGAPLWSLSTAKPIVDVGVPPPSWLGEIETPVAWAWYPRPGATLWSDWLAVVPRTPDVERRVTQRGHRIRVDKPASKPRSFHVMANAEVIVLGSAADLVRQAAGRGDMPRLDASHLVAARIDPGQMAPTIDALEAQITDRDRLGELSVIEGMLAPVESIDMSARVRDKTLQFDTTIRLRTATGARDDQLQIIDEWLATRTLKNSVALPRDLDRADSERTTVYRFALPDAKSMADRLFPIAMRSRLEVRVVDDEHLAVTVRPGSPAIGRTTLTFAERQQLIADLPRIQASAPKIRALARKLTKGAKTTTAKAQRIASWVAGNLTYEIAPTSSTALDVLVHKRGDCSEYSELTVALLRAAKIPAQLREGLLASDSSFVAHAWVAFFDGKRWVEIDPTNDRFDVGSGHVEVRLIDVLGLLSIESLRVVEMTTN